MKHYASLQQPRFIWIQVMVKSNKMLKTFGICAQIWISQGQMCRERRVKLTPDQNRKKSLNHSIPCHSCHSKYKRLVIWIWFYYFVVEFGLTTTGVPDNLLAGPLPGRLGDIWCSFCCRIHPYYRYRCAIRFCVSRAPPCFRWRYWPPCFRWRYWPQLEV